MAVKLRLQRKGRKKKPFYLIIAVDSRTKRDGKYIEQLGIYDPKTVPATIELDNDKALAWLQKGAIPTDTVHAILKYKGVMYKKHLLRGVEKGAFSEEEAEKRYQNFLEEKAQKLADAIKSREREISAETEKRLLAEKAKHEAMKSARAAELQSASNEEHSDHKQHEEEEEVKELTIDDVAKQAAEESGLEANNQQEEEVKEEVKEKVKEEVKEEIKEETEDKKEEPEKDKE